MSKNIDQAVKVLRQGGIIIYPTEGVYGLGCDPFNEVAVLRLLRIKHRSVKKGVILIAANWHQVEDLIKVDLKKYPIVKKSKEAITWIFPATKKAPSWITGRFNSIAIRVTQHKIAKKICQNFGGPIVSTSANKFGKPPITTLKQVDQEIVSNVDFIVSERVGDLGKPTKICEVKTSKVIRF